MVNLDGHKFQKVLCPYSPLADAAVLSVVWSVVCCQGVVDLEPAGFLPRGFWIFLGGELVLAVLFCRGTLNPQPKLKCVSFFLDFPRPKLITGLSRQITLNFAMLFHITPSAWSLLFRQTGNSRQSWEVAPKPEKNVSAYFWPDYYTSPGLLHLCRKLLFAQTLVCFSSIQSHLFLRWGWVSGSFARLVVD